MILFVYYLFDFHFERVKDIGIDFKLNIGEIVIQYNDYMFEGSLFYISYFYGWDFDVLYLRQVYFYLKNKWEEGKL